jgi:hypothetical protein
MKYEPLRRYLQAEGRSSLELTFEDVERIIGARLPASARTHAAWWSNNATGHVNAAAWVSAGFKTERLDLAAQKLTFRKAEERAPARSLGFLTRIRSEMGGMATIPDGVDICAPTGEVWDAER